MRESAISRRPFVVWLFGTILFAIILVSSFSAQDQLIAIRTIMLGLGAACVAILFGAILAWAAAGQGIFGRLSLVVCIAGLLIPVFMYLSAWDAAFGRLGWLTGVSDNILQPMIPPWLAGIWVHGMAATPQVAILFLVAHQIGSRTFEEQALLDADSVSVFFHVKIWRYLPVVGLGLFWILLTCSREIAVTDLYQIGTLAEQIYLGYSLGQLNSVQGNWTADELAAAEGLGLGISCLVIAWAVLTAGMFFWNVSFFSQRSRESRPSRKTKRSFTQSITALLFLFVFAAVPVFNLIYRCGFFVESRDGTPVPSWSFEQVIHSISSAATRYGNEYSWSATIALVSATVLIAFAIPLAWLCRSTTSRINKWRWLSVIVVVIFAALPGPLVGSWITKVFSSISLPTVIYLYDRTIMAPVIANVIFSLPIAFLISLVVMRNVSDDSLEAAQVEGAGPLTQFWRFGFRDQWLSVFGAWLLLFAFCYGELSASQLVLPPGMDTIPRLMLGLLHAGVDDATAGLTIVSIFVVSLLTLLGTLLMRLSLRRGK